MTSPVRIRKRPVEAEAYLYDGTNAADIVTWAEGHCYMAEGELYVMTDRQDAAVDPGDHVIHGAAGEWYPCRPEPYRIGWQEIDGWRS